MAQRRYFVGDALLGEIRETINTVNGTPSRPSTTVLTQSPVTEKPPAQLFRVGTASGAWAQGATKTVSWSPGSGVTSTSKAINIFAPVAEYSTSTYSCAIGRVGNDWYLLSAPSAVDDHFHLAEMNGSWSKGSTKTVNVIRTNQDITASNQLIDLVTTVTDCTTTVAIARDGTAWQLVSFEMAQESTSVLVDVTLSVDFNTSTCEITLNQTNVYTTVRSIYPDMCGLAGS